MGITSTIKRSIKRYVTPVSLQDPAGVARERESKEYVATDSDINTIYFLTEMF